ncbi:MAG: 30S ribosomal protein S9 [Thermodesulfobacteriota bacterium]
MEKKNVYYATGKRKNAVARTWIMPGTGKITVNDKPLDDYFTVQSSKIILAQPMLLTNTRESFDVMVKVKGGGVLGQAGAVRHGITRALILANPDLRQVLKKAGFVKRDSRVKERKKYGQRAARARFQFSKR